MKLARRMTAIVLPLLFLTTNSARADRTQAGGWPHLSPPFLIDNEGASQGDLVRDPSHPIVHFVFVKFVGDSTQIFYSDSLWGSRKINGLSQAEQISTSPLPAQNPSVAIAPDGTLHVVWERVRSGAAGPYSEIVTRVRTPEGVWKDEETIEEGTSLLPDCPTSGGTENLKTNRVPEIAVGEDGVPRIVWVVHERTVHWAVSVATGTGGGGTPTCQVMQGEVAEKIRFSQGGDKQDLFKNLLSTNGTPPPDTAPLIPFSENYFGIASAPLHLTVDKQGASHLAWVLLDSNNPFNLLYRPVYQTSLSASWHNKPIAVAHPDQGVAPSLAVSGEKVHFSWTSLDSFGSPKELVYRPFELPTTLGDKIVLADSLPGVSFIHTNLSGKPMIVAPGRFYIGRYKDSDIPVFENVSLSKINGLIAIDPRQATVNENGELWMTDGSLYQHTMEPNLAFQDTSLMEAVGPNTSVNLGNGNLFFNLPMMATEGKGFGASFELSWNSMEGGSTTLSRGWQHNYDTFITTDSTGIFVVLHLADGQKIVFITPRMWPADLKDPNGEPIPPPPNKLDTWYALPRYGFFAKMEKKADVSPEFAWELTTPSSLKYNFDAQDGKLTRIKDANENSLVLNYKEGALPHSRILDKVTDSANREFVYQYDDKDRLVSVTAPGNRIIKLEYLSDEDEDEKEALKSVTQKGESVPEGGGLPTVQDHTWKFSYHAETDFDDPEKKRVVNLLKEVNTPRGTKANFQPSRFFYEEDGRWDRSLDAYGKTRHVEWQDEQGRSLFSDRQKNKTTTGYDPIRALAQQIEDAKGQKWNRKFEDPFRNLTQSTDAKQNTTLFRHDYEKYEHVFGLVKKINRPAVQHPVEYDYLPPDSGAKGFHLNEVRESERKNGLQNTRYEYDDKGDLIKVKGPANEVLAEYQRDDSGRVVVSTDANGNKTTFTYDASTGLVATITRPGIAPEKFFYDEMGRLVIHVSPKGGQTDTFYDDLGRTIEVRAPKDLSGKRPITRYSYDLNSNLVSVTDPENNKTRFFYDALNRRIKTINPLQQVEEVKYNDDGDLTDIYHFSDANTKKLHTHYEYNELHQIKTKQDVGLSHEQYDYDENGRLASLKVTDPGKPAQTTKYLYDARGNLIKVTHNPTTGEGTGIQHPIDELFYNDNDLVIASQRLNGSQFLSGIATTYDLRNRPNGKAFLKAKFTVNGTPLTYPPTKFEYDGNSNVVTSEDPLGNSVTHVFDQTDRLISNHDAFGVKRDQLVYDNDSNLVEIRIPNPAGGNGWIAIQKNEFDLLGRRVSSTDPFGTKTFYHYNKNGFLDSSTWAAGTSDASISLFVPDALNRVKGQMQQVTGNQSRKVTYQLDANGNPYKTIDPRGKVTQYAYDALGRMTSMTAPGAASETFEYDGFGNLIKQVDPNGKTAFYTYDERNRLILEEHEDAQGVLFSKITREYDAADNLLAVSDDWTRQEFEYDYRNQVIKTGFFVEEGGFFVSLKSLEYVYDDAGRRETMTGPEGEMLTYEYDANNRLTGILRTGLTAPVAVITYDDKTGLKKSVTQANGLKTTFLYDKMGRPFQVETKTATGALAARWIYGYDKRGNVKSIASNHLKTTSYYTYDKADQLTAEGVFLSAFGKFPFFPRLMASYEYDLAGNRTESSHTRFGDQTDFVYTDDNRLLSYREDGRTVSFTYDGNGNVTSRWGGAAGEFEEFGYDHANRQVEYRRWDNPQKTKLLVHTDNLFSPSGLRLAKKDLLTGKQDWFVYDGPDVIADYSLDTAQGESIGEMDLAASYVNGLGIDERIAKYSKEGNQFRWTWDVTDHLGSIHQVRDSKGKEVVRYRTDVWGREVEVNKPKSADAERYGFTGREKEKEFQDPKTGLNEGPLFYRARMYDPRVGRFMQKDPILANRALEGYLYAENNPVNRVDPLGLQGEEPEWYDLFGWGGYAINKFDKWAEQKLLSTKSNVVIVPGTVVLKFGTAWGKVFTGVAVREWAEEATELGIKVHEDERRLGSGSVEAAMHAVLVSGATLTPFWEAYENYTDQKVSIAIFQGKRVRLTDWEMFTNAASGTSKAAGMFTFFADDPSVVSFDTPHASAGVPTFRIQGGIFPKASKHRLAASKEGTVSIEGQDRLAVIIGNEEPMFQFMTKRKGEAYLVRFEVTPEFAAKVRQLAVSQEQGRLFPNRPQIYDPSKGPGQYGIPNSMFEELMENIKPGSIKVYPYGEKPVP